MSAAFARRMFRTMEPIVGMIFFVPELNDPETGEVARMGIRPWPTGYFTSRGWALGRTSPQVIVSTFFNFSPAVATKGLPEVWDTASPEEIGAARDRAVVSAMSRITDGSDLPDIERTLDPLHRAVDACPPEGRPLFGAVASAPWPDDDPLLSLWHGCNRLREFRGDGHIALLVSEGIGAVEALVLHAGIGEVPKGPLLQTRAWSEDEWQAACGRLEERGLAKGEELTEEGRRLRESIEERTDELAMAPWRALGDAASELRENLRAIARLVVDNGGVPGRLGRKAVEEG